MKFNEKLQKMRKEKGMSQESLAEVLNVSRQAVSKWESGQSYPEMEKLITLSEMFGITLDALVKDGEIEKDQSNHISDRFWFNRGNCYEYKSKRTWLGLPLIHINIGRGTRKARGIVAIGNVANGFLSLGFASTGLISIGLASVGILSFGTFSVGGLLSMGALSFGAISIGAVAVGLYTIGAVSVGMFSFGAFSVASHVAIGDYANGHIAIGRIVEGVRTIEVEEVNQIFTHVSKEQVKELVETEFPNMWQWVINRITWFLK